MIFCTHCGSTQHMVTSCPTVALVTNKEKTSPQGEIIIILRAHEGERWSAELKDTSVTVPDCGSPEAAAVKLIDTLRTMEHEIGQTPAKQVSTFTDKLFRKLTYFFKKDYHDNFH